MVATGCGTGGGETAELVEIPEDGLYAGLVEVEKEVYAAGVRVDTKVCTAPFVLEVVVEVDEWFHMAMARCALGGRDGDLAVVLTPAMGSLATGAPMGLVGGSVPEMPWTGQFRVDGSFAARAMTTVDGTGGREDWTVTVTALSADAAFADEDTGL
jgi:hypothetical protein